MSASARFSVVIPARAEEPYLAESIESALAEGAAEILVVAPARSRSAELATALGALAVDTKAGVPNPKRNHGARLATAPVLAFLDADDRFAPGRMGAMAPALGDAVAGAVRSFISPDRAGELEGRVRLDPRPRPGLVSGALIFGRDAFLAIGGFREDLATGEGADWLDRADRAGMDVARIGSVVLERRIHGGNHLSAEGGSAVHDSYLRIARERIVRARRR